MTTAEVNSIAVCSERDLAIAASADAAAQSASVVGSGALVVPRSRALSLVGIYFLVWGVLLILVLAAYLAAGEFGPRGAGLAGWPLLQAWLPYALLIFMVSAFLLVGIGLLKQRTWARWGGVALALMFLADGIASPWERTADIASVLIAFFIPIAALAVLLSPRRRKSSVCRGVSP